MRTFAPIRMRGFSLIELMISLVIGMLALMFATRMFAGGEQTKQAALGGSDSMQNGMLAMFSISSDVAQAGYGLNDQLLAGCDTLFSDSGGYAMASAERAGATIRPLAAAVIQSGGAKPDTITLYSGNAIGGTGTLRLTTDYIGGVQLNVDRIPYGFAQGDVVVVAPENRVGPCALAQISNDPGSIALPPAQQFILVAPAANTRFNDGVLGGANFTGGVARIFNLGPAGKLAFHTWSVQDGFLRLRSTDLAGAGTGAVVADNIVSIKAQYGFDTRAGAAFTPQTGLQVGEWTNAMIDADGDSVAGSQGDYERIAALRIAVVARSKNPERPDPGTGLCTATTVPLTVFGRADTNGVPASEVTINVEVAGNPVDWRCYRYRVFETIVPLRNALWRP
jgi:type IV pilus assembly protein PilW